jgi:hypothetical protein
MANSFSASPGGKNYDQFNGTVVTSVITPCINALMLGNATCASANQVPNAARVVETATIPTYFMRVFGVSTLTVKATATAEQQGIDPWNVAIILDATPSMNQTDPNCVGNTSEQCALSGIQQMLHLMYPCTPGLQNCNDATQKTALVRVSMFTFPNVPTVGSGISGDVSNDYNCGQATAYPYTLPPIPPYPPNHPNVGDAGQTGWDAGYKPVTYTGANATNGNPNKGKYASTFTATYQVTPPNVGNADANGFLTDFYDSKGTNNLNASSILVKAVGNGVNKGCLTPPTSLTDANGYSGDNGTGVTYLAGAIYAAQAALQAEKKAADAILGVSTNNALIVVSDGQMNTNKGMFPIGDGYSGVTNGILALAGNGTYPSNIDACQQAMLAAQRASNSGITVFGVAYGSETSGCTKSSGDDTSVISPLPSYVSFSKSFTTTGQILPCVTMENIASAAKFFYAEVSSDDCTVTLPSNAPMNNLPAIFEAITSKLGPGSRLIPNSLN